MHRELSETDYDILIAFVFEAKEQGTHFSGMTFEDGIEAVIDVMEGNSAAGDVTEV